MEWPGIDRRCVLANNRLRLPIPGSNQRCAVPRGKVKSEREWAGCQAGSSGAARNGLWCPRSRFVVSVVVARLLMFSEPTSSNAWPARPVGRLESCCRRMAIRDLAPLITRRIPLPTRLSRLHHDLDLSRNPDVRNRSAILPVGRDRPPGHLRPDPRRRESHSRSHSLSLIHI